MNTAAAVFICIPAVVYAVFIRNQTIKKIKFFESFYKFTYLFGVYSSVSGREITDVVLDIIKNENSSVLKFAENACKKIENGTNLARAWNEAVEHECRILNHGEKALVCRFISAVSAGDIFTQEKTMKIYLEELEIKLKNLAEYEKKDMKAKCAAVIFIGCTAALVVI